MLHWIALSTNQQEARIIGVDEQDRALFREALDLFKRHVETQEKSWRAIQGWRFAVRIMFPMIVLVGALALMSLFHLW